MPLNKCPCAKKLKTCPYLQCTTCDQWWHTRCVSLKGLDADTVKLLTEWVCPLCYTPPATIPLGKLESIVKSESAKISEAIKKVQESVSKNKISSVVMEAVSTKLTEHVDSFTEVISANSENTRRILGESIQNNNQEVVKEVVESSKRQMDNDAMAREARKCNVVIRDVTESDSLRLKGEARPGLGVCFKAFGCGSRENSESDKSWSSYKGCARRH